MSEPFDCWRECRRRRNILLFAFLGFVPSVAVIGLVGVRLFHTDWPFSIAAISWMIFFVLAGIRYESFRCPRCHKWFFVKWWCYDIFARRCLHCGLPKYASPVPNDCTHIRSRKA